VGSAHATREFCYSTTFIRASLHVWRDLPRLSVFKCLDTMSGNCYPVCTSDTVSGDRSLIHSLSSVVWTLCLAIATPLSVPLTLCLAIATPLSVPLTLCLAIATPLSVPLTLCLAIALRFAQCRRLPGHCVCHTDAYISLVHTSGRSPARRCVDRLSQWSAVAPSFFA
jgi:hypothetical protein